MAYDYNDPFWGNGFQAEALETMNPMNLVLPPGRILVKDVAVEYKGRIAIPNTASREPASTGLVIQTGPGPRVDWAEAQDEDGNGLGYAVPIFGIPAVQRGQVVMFAQHVGSFLKFDQDMRSGARYRILNGWEDILAVFNPPTEDENGVDDPDASVGCGSSDGADGSGQDHGLGADGAGPA
jgi:co-chaperonin GroES (HSP10)